MVAPKRQVLVKFLLLLMILVGYFGYLTYQYDFLTGGVAALITWSFFVLCTPVADAGFLLDFPLRLLFGIRMVVSEIVVWAIAISINLLAIFYSPEYYQTTFITRLCEVIILNPYPYWAIVGLSAVGTFLSIRFGDELMDVFHHKDRLVYFKHHFKHEIILLVFFLVVIFSYYQIMSTLGIQIQD
ncbi:hypothetical protein [Paraglaciecola sp. L3A3]|uniref:hypothetical protein n=1 Tax=Paraglaciecola sp. L3A3 TaxID=2686358 RepID=UPI0018EEEE0B|nr:hypothetical protein [Paraglaciecola sp. L3A3]